MAQLNNKQVDRIYDLLIDHGVSYDTLKIDLLDHICCMVEEKMDNGLDFGQSLTLSVNEFGLSSLSEIQEATIHLITLKLKKMKKVVGIVGIIGALAVIAGVLFKVNHYAGAGILLVLGLCTIVTIVFPAMAYFDALKGKSALQRIGIAAGYIAAILLSLATLFKIMHWPGFFMLYYPGLFLLVLVFMPIYTIRNYKTAENKIMAFSRSLLILAGVVVMWGIFPILLSDKNVSVELREHSSIEVEAQDSIESVELN